MKSPCALLLGIISLQVQAQELNLTEGDRQALLDRLEEVQKEGGERAELRKGDAYAAFKGAVGDDKAAFSLWIKCAEKVRFTEQKRDSQAFREWKRGQGDRLDSAPYHRAVRHQLSWLLLAIEASRAGNDQAEAIGTSSKAIARIDAVLADGEILKERVAPTGREREPKPAYRVLEESAFRSEFARAYDVASPKDWPDSPLKVQEVYEKVILKPYADAKDFENFRNAWMKMVVQLATLAEIKGREADTGGKSANFEKFIQDTRPELRWELEKRIFEMGDQKSAAKNMIGLLEEYAGHKKEVSWATEFQNLLKG